MTEPEVDIHALLSVALNEPPPDALAERVAARVAALTTVVEFAKLIGLAPSSGLLREAEDAEDEDNSDA